MNLKTKRTIKAGLLYAVFFLAVGVLAANMSLPTIPNLGGGEGTVTSLGDVVSYTWVLSGTPTKVTGVTLKFSADLTSGTTIYITLLNGSDVALTSGSQTLTSTLSAGNPVTVTMSPSVSAAAICKVAVTVVGP
jgi:hypothetical protein